MSISPFPASAQVSPQPLRSFKRFPTTISGPPKAKNTFRILGSKHPKTESYLRCQKKTYCNKLRCPKFQRQYVWNIWCIHRMSFVQTYIYILCLGPSVSPFEFGMSQEQHGVCWWKSGLVGFLAALGLNLYRDPYSGGSEFIRFFRPKQAGALFFIVQVNFTF